MSALAQILSTSFSPRMPGGLARLAALFCFLLALIGAIVVLLQPQTAHWAGVALLGAIGAAAWVLLVGIWPRLPGGMEEARRIAEAAAFSNVAWAVTAKDGSVVDCNIAYRFLAGAGEGEPPAPPQLAFPGEGPAAALYRLGRAAAEGRARREDFRTECGPKPRAAGRRPRRRPAPWWRRRALPPASPR